MADYYTILTNAGIAYETAAKAAGTPIKLSKMSVGDGNGAVYNPDATAVALKREVWRGDINALIQDKSNPSWLVAELTIPDSVGGWSVREAGIWTDTGILYAIIKYPESYKPVLATSGAGKEFYIRAIFQTSNAATVTLSIDETVVKATRAWVIEYVAAELAKQDWKKSVRAVATSAITLSGPQTIDTVVLVTGDRVLVTGQAAAKDNGIYIVGTPWVRADDANLSIEVSPNLFVLVEEGATYGDSAWQLVTNGAIVLGTTALTFEMAFGRTGVAAGGYQKVTVDKYGRVVSGTNPTTLAGFGIQDAFTKTETAKAVSDAIAALVASSPNALDTLNELASALGNDPNFAATMTAQLGLKAPKDSPIFTGDPRVPTAAVGDSDLSAANTAFVQAALAVFGWGVNAPGSPTVTDYNAATLGGVYKAGAGALNAPEATGTYILLVLPFNGGTTLQIAGRATASDANNRIYWRTSSGTFTNWKEFGALDSPALTGSPTAPTPAVGDTSTRIANMSALAQAVSAANRAFNAGVTNVTASTTLLPSATGSVYRIGGAGGYTFTLPSAVDVLSGRSYVLRNESAAAVTLNAPAGSIFSAYGLQGPSITLARDEWVEILASGTNWVIATRGKLSEVATLDSPVFTGDPRVPTAAVGDNDTTIANTAFACALLASFGIGTFTGPLAADLNTTVLGGAFRTTNTTANTPVSGNLSGFTFPYNNGGCLQIASQLGGVGRFFWRTQAGGNWTPWREAAATDSPALTGNPTVPTAPAGDNSLSIANTAFVRGVTGNMVGMVGHFAMSTPPDGWLKRNGAAVSRTTYAALFAAIGTTFGAGDGSTTFNLPDSRGYFDRGWDDARGLDSGRVFGSNQASQNLSHNHTGTALAAGSHSHTSQFAREKIPVANVTDGGNAVMGDESTDGFQTSLSSVAPDHTHGLSIAASGGSEARPINQAFLACIKY